MVRIVFGVIAVLCFIWLWCRREVRVCDNCSHYNTPYGEMPCEICLRTMGGPIDYWEKKRPGKRAEK